MPTRPPSRAGTRLRLIATTDLHMALTGVRLLGEGRTRSGLSALAPAIRSARAEVDHALLFDIGDAFQGGPLTDDLDPDDAHPMQQALNALDYDAQTVGNHDLDFGLDALHRTVEQATAPVVCANLLDREGVPILDPYRVLSVETADGPLRVGITGVLPPRVMRWNRHHLEGRVRAVEAARAVAEVLPELRLAGADLVVVLAHTGIVPFGHPEIDEQAALSIAALDGVDAVLCGHQHRSFPGHDFGSATGIDPVAGTLAGKPALMAGWAGERVGVLDLDLDRRPGYWRVTGHRAAFRLPMTEPDAQIEAIAAPHIVRTRARLAKPLSRTDVPLDTTFAALGPSAAVGLLHAAFLDAGRQRLGGDLPVLAAASAFRSGGRAGPNAFTRIEPGPLTHRSVADLCPFSNRIVAVEATGAQIRDWLEMASGFIAHLDPEGAPGMLLNPEMPGYNFDAIAGVTYTIDPTRTPSFTAAGEPVAGAPGRVQSLCHAGVPIRPDARFAVVANSYRTGGGGNFPGLSELPLLDENLGDTVALVTRWLERHPEGITLPAPNWALSPAMPVRALYRTGAGVPDLAALAPHRMEKIDVTPDGWHDWQVELRPAV